MPTEPISILENEQNLDSARREIQISSSQRWDLSHSGSRDFIRAVVISNWKSISILYFVPLLQCWLKVCPCLLFSTNICHLQWFQNMTTRFCQFSMHPLCYMILPIPLERESISQPLNLGWHFSDRMKQKWGIILPILDLKKICSTLLFLC